jgi:hypothetical protein
MRTTAILALIGAASADCIGTPDVCHELDASCTCYAEWFIRETKTKADMEVLQAKAKNDLAVGTAELTAAE